MNELTQLPPELTSGSKETLAPLRQWPSSSHVFDEDSIEAVNAALAAGRPLLLRGEPGSGKSQLARAVASVLNWPFLSRVVNGRFEPEDLLYRFDAVARLSEAQMGKKTGEELKAENFLLPEALWWALSSDSAKDQYEKAASHCGEAAINLLKNWVIASRKTKARFFSLMRLIRRIQRCRTVCWRLFRWGAFMFLMVAVL